MTGRLGHENADGEAMGAFGAINSLREVRPRPPRLGRRRASLDSPGMAGI